MLRVEKFLCCFKLETGGLVIGWLSFIGNILCLLGALALIALFSFMDCDDLKKLLQDTLDEPWEAEFDESFNSMCNIGRGVCIVVLIIMAIILCGFIYIAYLCIKGTGKRDHILVKPIMVLFGVYTVFSFLGVLSLTANGIVMGLLEGCIHGYVFVCLYSLYDMFRLEYERGFTAQYHTPIGKA